MLATLSEQYFKCLAALATRVIAEKLEAMVALGNANGRMKDFYDVWTCSRHLDR